MSLTATTSTSQIKLASNNYTPWKRETETIVAKAGLTKHLTYPNFVAYQQAEYQPSDREIRFNKQLKKIKDDIKNGLKDKTISNIAEAEELEEKRTIELEKTYSDAATWSNEKAKAARSWTENEEKLFGLLRGSVESQYWTNIKNTKSVYQAWRQLKKEAQQDQPGTLMALLIKFFNARIEPEERLTTYTARIQGIADEITDLGHNFVPPILVCYLILSTMPSQYESIQQSIFQLPTPSINLDVLKAKFSAEDARQDANRSNKPDDQKSGTEAAFSTTLRKPRKCESCPNMIGAKINPHFTRCSPCQKKYLDEKGEKKEANTTVIQETAEKSERSNSNRVMVL